MVLNSEASWKVSRSPLATSVFMRRFVASATAAAQKIIGFVAGSPCIDEPARRHELAQPRKLLEQLLVEPAPRLISGEGLVPVRSAPEAYPIRPRPRGAARPQRGAAGNWRSRRWRRLACCRPRESSWATHDRNGARRNRRQRPAEVRRISMRARRTCLLAGFTGMIMRYGNAGGAESSSAASWFCTASSHAVMRGLDPRIA